MPNPYGPRLGEFSSFVFEIPKPKGSMPMDSFVQDAPWCSFFWPPPAKLICEIGCSTGVLLVDVAERAPATVFMGIDWKFKSLYKAAEKLQRRGLKNTVLFRGLAQQIGALVGEGSVDEVWIFFPDPWQKASQRKHRVVQAPFLLSLARVLKPGGRVVVKTDHPGYFQSMTAILGVTPNLSGVDGSPKEKGYGKLARQQYYRQLADPDELPAKDPDVCRLFEVKSVDTDYEINAHSGELFNQTTSLFERAFSREGLAVYFLELKKRDRLTAGL